MPMLGRIHVCLPGRLCVCRNEGLRLPLSPCVSLSVPQPPLSHLDLCSYSCSCLCLCAPQELEREEKRRAAFQHRDERLQSFLAKRSSDSRVATLLASGTVTTSALAPPQPGPTSYMEPGPRGPTHTAGATVGRAGPRAPPSGAAGDAGGGSGQTPSHSSGTTKGASGGGGGAVVAPNGAKLDLLKSKRGSAARRPREPASPVL